MIIKFLTGALLLASFAPAARAQSSSRFDGRLVHEETGAPLADASVSIVGVTGTARTDSDGRFSWAPAPEVPFQVIVVLSGGAVARPATVETLHEGTTTIRVGALSDQSVTVLGAAPSIEAAPAAATTLLSASQITQRNPETLMQALETVPGISQVSEGHAAVPAVRGLARGRTLFLIDGARVTAERRVGPSGTFLDPSVIEGIDIARGPGSVAYGSDALGGVVSVRTRRAEPGAPLKSRVTATIGAGVPERGGAFEVSKGLASGGVLAQAHVRHAADYDSPDGEIFNSAWEDQGALLNFSHAAGKGVFSAAWQGDYGRDFGRPRNNSRAVRFYYPFENSNRFTTSYELPGIAGFRQIAFNAFLGWYDQRTDQDRFATVTAGRGIERADVSANDFHVKASAERLAGPARVQFGVDVNGRFNLRALDVRQAFDLAGRLTSDSTNVSIDEARRTDAGMYVDAETALGPRVRLAGGARLDRVTSANVGGYFGDRSSSTTAASGLAAVTVEPFERFSVTGQIARGFRDPMLSDRYYRGPSGRGYITGNPDLEPETSLQLDFAARYTVGQAQLAAYWYEYRIDDLVERYQTATDFFFFRNRGRASVRGVEVEARAALGLGYSLEAAAQLARGRALDDSANLDDIAAPSVSVIGRKEFARGVHAHARVAWHADDTRPGPTEVASPGATLVDIGGGWLIAPFLELRGIARNLLDETYYASPDPRWVAAPGRSVSLTASLQF